MKALLVILSTVVIIFLTACDEEIPTGNNFFNGLRTIKVYNLNSGNISYIDAVSNAVYNCLYPDSSYFTFATFYVDVSELRLRDLKNKYHYNRYYFGTDPINAIKIYPEENEIFLSNSVDIYQIKNYGEVVTNLTTNDIGECTNPVFIPQRNLVIYGSYSFSYNNGRIFSQNLATSEIDTILNNYYAPIYFPIFATNDGSHLIYLDYDLQYYSIKSINLDNPNDIQVFIPSIGKLTIGKNKSIDDKIALTSSGTVYLLDLNSGELTEIISGAQFADLSSNGEKIVFTTAFEMYLINSDGSELEKLVSKVHEKLYLFLPSFSLNNEQIVYIESEYPFSYDDYRIH